jgi:F-type H+-transporting ATPase subunit b
MLVDWFTVGAQALNFVILVGLMKRFLYGPILRAIDTREKRIAAELADADARRGEATKERNELQKKNEALDAQRGALLSKATNEAKDERRRLLDEARQAADALSAKRQDSLRAEARELLDVVRRRTQDEVFAIARKALADLATSSLEERMGEVFTRRLREMDDEAKVRLGEALSSPGPAVVRTAFELPAEQQEAIRSALGEAFAANIPVRFETAPEVVCGIELAANGQKVTWSIAGYLASLERGVAEVLSENDRPVARPDARQP